MLSPIQPLKPYTIVIIGYGRVGRFFEGLFNLIPHIQVMIKTREQQDYPKADLFLICVQDQEIPKVAKELENHVQSSAFGVVHCSGFRSLSILEPLKNLGCQIAVIHPVAPITYNTVSAENMVMDALGDDELMVLFEYWCSEWGAYFVPINEAQKQSIHVAAVMSCNYLMCLYGHVQKYLVAQGMESVEANHMVQGMMSISLQELDFGSVESSLTGPIIRGDLQTIQHHLQLLDGQRSVLDLYRSLGTSTLDLIEEFTQKPLNATIQEMRALFSNTNESSLGHERTKD